MIKNFLKLILGHKIITGIVVLVIIGGGYYGYTKVKGSYSQTSYVLATVQKGTLISSVSGSGQVSVSNQVDIKAKVSGDIVYLGTSKGQEVKAGTLLVQLDTSEAQKSVRDAQANLDSALLSLEKLKKPADQLSILQAENSLAQAKESKQKAEDDLVKAYEDGFNTVANAFLELPSVMAGLNDILFANTFQTNQWNIDYYTDAVKPYDEKILNYRTDALNAYNTARSQYNQNFIDYKSASRFSDNSTIEKLIDQTYETTKGIAEAVKSTNNLIQFYQDKLIEKRKTPHSVSTTHLSTLGTYTGQTNSHLSSLLSIKRTIQTDKESIVNASRSIEEKTESLAELKAGPDPFDIQSQELTIQQRQNALTDAKEKLADYYIYAPFDGVMASVDVKKGDTISSASSIATEITKQRVAEIPLNEVDIAKIKTGQKATLTFDAIEDLSITGEVADIDALGTVSQGVVTYNVKIVFDTQDERVKPGMSISSAIITDIKQDVLLAPNSAIKSSGGTNYVEMLNSAVAANQAGVSNTGVTSKTAPFQQQIQIGLANDSFTEVISGLKEGDRVVTQTIAANATQTQSQSTEFRIPGFGGVGR